MAVACFGPERRKLLFGVRPPRSLADPIPLVEVSVSDQCVAVELLRQSPFGGSKFEAGC